MFLRVSSFLTGEDGAITVDWVVLVAAVAILSVPVVTTFGPGLMTVTESVGEAVVELKDLFE